MKDGRTVCPNCNKKLNGLLATSSIISEDATTAINLYYNDSKEAYCTSCSPGLVAEGLNKMSTDLKALVDLIPVVTINNPKGWDYTVLNMVSSQSVAGTGFLSEFSSSWSDFVGGQSNGLAEKVNAGELTCKRKLRYKAALLGGNAVIATDIDYAEVGGAKGMLMVCMAGTAVKVTNLHDVVKVDDRLESLNKTIEKFRNLKAVKISHG